MLKFLAFLLMLLLIFPRLLRLLASGRRPARRQKGPAPDATASTSDSLRDLTRQDISDAEFEEIPPEE